MEELALKIENISKEYRLGTIGGGTLKSEIESKLAKMFHKEDPNLKIGEEAHDKNERFLALDGVSFDIKKGERIGILGHNGAGKSTLLKLICRVTAPSTGTIYMSGRITSMLEVGTGFHGELTGKENIYLNGAILGMSKEEIDRRYDEIVEFSEIGQFIDTPIKRYSSGMKVKLGFAIASHLDSEIMIMDEVLAVGDMAFQMKCIEQMKRVADEEGRTILYVSHNMNTIRQLCNRCVVLEHGKLIYDGDVESAIDIYMPKAENDIMYSNDMDLSVKNRPENSLNLIKMNHVNLSIAKDCKVQRGEHLKFKIDWDVDENIGNVSFRSIVRFVDDTPVGLVQSEPLGSYAKGQKLSTVFDFDTSFLAEGIYYMSIAFYCNNGLGTTSILDHISRAIRFEIINNFDCKTDINWEHKWWGSVHFPNFKIEDNTLL